MKRKKETPPYVKKFFKDHVTTKNWFKKHASEIQFGSLLVTFIALIFTIIYSTVNINMTREGVKKAQQSFDLAQDEFHYGKEQNNKAEIKANKTEIEAEKKYAHQDSINKIQLKTFQKQSNIFGQQLVGLQQAVEILRTSTAGDLRLTGIDTTRSDGYVGFTFFNVGKRKCWVKNYGFAFWNEKQGYYQPFVRVDNTLFIESNTGITLNISMPKTYIEKMETFMYFEFLAHEYIYNRDISNLYYSKNPHIENGNVLNTTNLSVDEQNRFHNKMTLANIIFGKQ